MKTPALWFVVAFALFVTGCGNAVDDARTYLSKTWSCPIERVEVTRRDDLDGAALYRQSTRSAPPDDVAADPARLAVFKANEAAATEKAAASYGNAVIIDGRGCDKEVRLAYFRNRKKSSDQPWFHCSDAPQPRLDR